MKKAFTLIELLVVVLIIGILAAAAMPQYQKAVLKARFAELTTVLDSIGKAYQVCALEHLGQCDLNDQVNWEKLVITLPSAMTSQCAEDSFCFYTKNWEIAKGAGGSLFAYPREGNNTNNNLQLEYYWETDELQCMDDRGEKENAKTYDGYCRFLNLE